VPVSLPILQVGNRSGAVRSLQTLLITKAGQRIAADGVFGPRTRDAVLNVQRYFRLTPDGIVGAKTWPTLFL
jgi:peptidoglycan hydrolase-like protein with peptidoglycan-binding domain